MKNIIIIMTLFILVLAACSQNSLETSNKESSLDNANDVNESRVLLNELRQEFELLVLPQDVLEKAIKEVEVISDGELEKEYIAFINEMIVEIVKYSSDFERLKGLEKYDQYLNEDVKQSLTSAIDKNTSIEIKLKDAGYKIEFMSSYDGIGSSGFRPDIIRRLDAKGKSYEFICNQPCAFMVISNTVIEFNDLKVKSIFNLKDDKDQIVNPLSVEALVEIARLDSVNSSNEQKESTEQYRAEQEEKYTVRLGMSKEEVLSKLGEPKDINKTVSKFGTSEQWVYYDGVYLYFEDGILETVQE